MKMADLYEERNACFPDLDREQRIGFAEVIYCPGKTPEQLRELAEALFAKHKNVLATRASPEQAELLQQINADVRYDATARVAYLQKEKTIRGRGLILVVAAGTCDKHVAQEAACVSRVMGNRTECINDVGIAGLHRILSWRDKLRSAAAVIVVAGMEGALPSAVAGLVACPVIAVPTSVGYGASFNGLAPLLGMLNSCAPGVVVCNIDNGFGAAYAASRINCPPKPESPETSQERAAGD